jgi:membrane protease YdiL (CAAX protease family)
MARVSFAGVKQFGIALAWLVLFTVVSVGVIIGLAEAAPGWGDSTWFIARNGIFGVIGFGVATIVVGRLLNKRSWSAMGWRPRTGVSFAHGLALGAAMATLAILLAVVLGARVSFTGDWNVWAGIALPLIVGLVFAAVSEELAFRGYPLQRLADAIGVIPAMLVVAVLFGLAHTGNDNATTFGIINIALAAIWLSLAFFSAGGMGLAWGAHLGWNAGLAVLFDAPVSGFRFQVPVVEYTPGTHAWVDGGAFGPEGGVVTTIVLMAASLYLLMRRGMFSAPELQAPAQVAAA